MSSEPATSMPPLGEGLMIVAKDSAVVIGTPGRVHAEFYATVKGLAHQFNADGRPPSGSQA